MWFWFQIKDSFPWESLPKSASVGIASTDKVAAVKVHIGIASAKLAVCRHLHAGMSRVSEAIVFDQVYLGLGNIDKLHCLHSTSQHIGMSNVKQITYHHWGRTRSLGPKEVRDRGCHRCRLLSKCWNSYRNRGYWGDCPILKVRLSYNFLHELVDGAWRSENPQSISDNASY